MKGKRICSLIAGILNLLYAVMLLAGIIVAIVAAVSITLGFNSMEDSLAAVFTAFAGVIIIGIVIIALIVMVPPFVCTLISSIGLIKRAVKCRHPKGPAILSIVIHSLLLIGYLIGIIACLTGGAAGLAIVFIVIGLLLSAGNIVLCGIALSGWNREQPAE